MLKLVQIDNGVFDLAFNDPALGDVLADAATVVYAALFTDAVAPAEIVPNQYDRRGWWANPQAGSGLWYLRRQPLSDAVRLQTLNMVQTVLSSHSGTLSNVEVIPDTAVAGNVSGVFLTISGNYDGREFIMSTAL